MRILRKPKFYCLPRYGAITGDEGETASSRLFAFRQTVCLNILQGSVVGNHLLSAGAALNPNQTQMELVTSAPKLPYRAYHTCHYYFESLTCILVFRSKGPGINFQHQGYIDECIVLYEEKLN